MYYPMGALLVAHLWDRNAEDSVLVCSRLVGITFFSRGQHFEERRGGIEERGGVAVEWVGSAGGVQWSGLNEGISISQWLNFF
jgi:hypothetical protein